MLSEHHFQYAIENTEVILAPDRHIQTFGSTLINYYLITEDMDQLSLTRVREGQIQAERPQIISPHQIAKLLVEGFGEKAEAFADYVSSNPQHFAFLKYGFKMKKDEFQSYEAHEPKEAILEKVKAQIATKNDPFAAILTGVDDAWEVSLLKFMVDMMNSSAAGNVNDLRRKGLL
ncbi:MAG: hypothetical protein V4507_09415 [Verrucomicrobiota bacterium]